MHWAEKIAAEIIKRNPNKEEYVCSSGISPSGSVHIGNFRDIATSFYVVKALERAGKKARLLFSWDEFDRLRKVPSNVAKITEGFEQYLGMPYSMIPDPHGECASYAEYNEKEFEQSLKELDINPDFRYQSKEYRSLKYADKVVYSLQKRKEIYDILMSFKTQDGDEDERESYAPVNVYCDKCFKDTTEVLSVSDDGEELTYKCKCCGNEKSVKVREYDLIKLVWKVDWPMRWSVEGVDFEPGGIDHAAASGSYVVACDVAKKIFGIEPPLFQGYGWLSIAGLGDMHSSTGMNITPAGVLEVYEPDMIRWLFAKYEPKAAFSFNFDDTIIRHYSEFDKGLEAYRKKEIDEYNEVVYDFSLIDNEQRAKVPFGVLASVAPIVDFNAEAVRKILNKIGVEFTVDDESRLLRVKNWITKHQPSKLYKLLPEKNVEYISSLTDEEKQVLNKLYVYLRDSENLTEKAIMEFLYSIINDPELTKKENQLKQQRYFKIFYNALFGTDMGPRLYLFLSAIDKEQYLHLLEV